MMLSGKGLKHLLSTREIQKCFLADHLQPHTDVVRRSLTLGQIAIKGSGYNCDITINEGLGILGKALNFLNSNILSWHTAKEQNIVFTICELTRTNSRPIRLILPGDDVVCPHAHDAYQQLDSN